MLENVSIIAPAFRKDRTPGNFEETCRHRVSILPQRCGAEVSWRKIAISNNVGSVKNDVRTRLHALVEERHFALVDRLRFPTWARF